jgi:hypothetical protein
MESVIAEKFDAMVSRGMTNSRVKDFYDIWLLSRQYKFESHKLAEAIRLTFGQRHTELPREILAFSQEFIEEKQTQWTTFRNKLGQEHIPKSFQDIVNTIEMFLTPVIFSLPHKKSTPTLLEIKEQLKLAISQHLKVEIYYKDDMQNRLVNPYHYGNLGGADHLHAFQVSGNSKSNTPTGWKNFLISDISNLKVTANNFLAPDDGYNPRAPDYLVEHKIHYDIKQKSKSQLESLEETV